MVKVKANTIDCRNYPDINFKWIGKRIDKIKTFIFFKELLAAGVFRAIRLVARLPFAFLLLFLLPRDKFIDLNEPHNYSWLLKNIRNYKILLFTYISRYSRNSSPILANAHFRLRGREWHMVLNLNEYTQCNYYFGNVNLPLLRLISNGTTNESFLDIGANVGLYSLAASELFGKVIAFEPDPRSLSLLKKNITLSKALTVSIAPIALSDKIGTAVLIIDPFNQGGSSLNTPGGNYSLKDEERNFLRKKPDSISESLSVQLERLDDYLVKCETKNIRLV